MCVVLQSNYLVFMAELFWWFEVVKPSFVQPRVFNTNGTVEFQYNLTGMQFSLIEIVDAKLQLITECMTFYLFIGSL